MFIWDFVAAKVLGQIVDWFYSQIVGFLGNFFSEMGNMGAELFTMDWVQSIVLFFSYLAWALYGTGLVVACFETSVEYSSGRGNIRETALNAIKGFMAVSLFTIRPDGRAAAGLRQRHQRDHDPVLPYPHGLCLSAFLQATILVAGLMVFKDHALLGLGLMLSAGEIPRIAGAFGLDTSTKANLMSAVYTAQAAVNTTRTVVQAVAK